MWLARQVTGATDVVHITVSRFAPAGAIRTCVLLARDGDAVRREHLPVAAHLDELRMTGTHRPRRQGPGIGVRAGSARFVELQKHQIGQEAARIVSGKWPMSLVNPQVRAKIPARAPATGV